MKKIALALVSTALVSSAAMAADGASFTGFNLGANLGWSVGSSRFAANQTSGLDTDSFTHDIGSKGAVGGLSVGYGKQFGKGYLGLEAWGSLSNTNGTVSTNSVKTYVSALEAVLLANNQVYAFFNGNLAAAGAIPRLQPVDINTALAGTVAQAQAINPGVMLPGGPATAGVNAGDIAGATAGRAIAVGAHAFGTHPAATYTFKAPQSMTNTLNAKVQRRNELGLSLKAGYVWGNAMAYATMGISSASFKTTGTYTELDMQAVANVVVPAGGIAAGDQIVAAVAAGGTILPLAGVVNQNATPTTSFSSTKRVMGFVPGLGVDVKVTNNVSLGMKVTHTFYRNHNIAGASFKHQVTDVRPSITYTW